MQRLVRFPTLSIRLISLRCVTKLPACFKAKPQPWTMSSTVNVYTCLSIRPSKNFAPVFMTGPLFEARRWSSSRTLAILVSESISVSFPAQESAESQSLFSPPLSGQLGSVSVGTTLASAVSGPGGAGLPLSGSVGSVAGTAAAMSGVRASAISACRDRSSFCLCRSRRSSTARERSSR